MRGFKRDEQATAAAYEWGIFLDKKKRSFVSLPKKSDHGFIAHNLLAGIDRSDLHDEVRDDAQDICFYCGMKAYDGEMCHKNHKAGKKCDCLANVHWGHHDCHMKSDHSNREVRLGTIKGV